MPTSRRRAAIGAAVLGPALALSGFAATAGASAAHPRPHVAQGWHVQVIAKNPVVSVDGVPFALSDPDDITRLGKDIFVSWQNGLGPQGQASSKGVTFSTITEYGPHGGLIADWQLTGKCDGVTADAATKSLVATVNEDADSSVYTITPGAAPAHQVVHYSYGEKVLPHGGGTDAITIDNGRILLSASAPGTTPTSAAKRPAVYQVTFVHRAGAITGRASLTSVFFDTSTAKVANTKAPTMSSSSPNPPSYCPAAPAPCAVPGKEGSRVTLALTDPDSSEMVPTSAPRFGGDFVLDSQGDQQLIFVSHLGTRRQALTDLYLSQSVDDTAFASVRGGTIYVTDATHNDIVAVTGPIVAGEAITSGTPGDANNPGKGPSYIGRIDYATGTVTAVPALKALEPGGMLYVAP